MTIRVFLIKVARPSFHRDMLAKAGKETKTTIKSIIAVQRMANWLPNLACMQSKYCRATFRSRKIIWDYPGIRVLHQLDTSNNKWQFSPIWNITKLRRTSLIGANSWRTKCYTWKTIWSKILKSASLRKGKPLRAWCLILKNKNLKWTINATKSKISKVRSNKHWGCHRRDHQGWAMKVKTGK